MTEIIEKLEHGIMICSATGTMLVHIEKGDAEKIVALLKEQEAVEPRVEYDAEDDCHWCVCGKCGKNIDWYDKFCRMCGTPVKVE